MGISRILVAVVLVVPVLGQPLSPECQQLQARLEAFLSKYNPYRKDGLKATLKTVEEELGMPRLERDPISGTTKAVFVLDGCSGKVLIDEKGIAWMTGFSTVPTVPPPQIETLQQLQNIDKNIRNLQTQLEGLQALRTGLIKQAVQVQPLAPEQQLAANATGRTTEADSLFGVNRFDEAVTAYTKVLADSPSDARVLLRRGYCFHRLGKLDEAIRDYTDSIRITPSSVVYSNRAIAYLARNQTDEALADFERSKSVESTAAFQTDNSLPSTSIGSSSGGSVNVKGYFRKDGTYVSPHTRSAPHGK